MEATEFGVVDLFSGAGGMSYGFHKHPAFRIVAAADAEIGILHDDGQGVAGRLPLLRFLAEAADRAQRFQLCEKALLDAIDLGEVVERLVGEFRVGRVFQDG